MKQIILFLLFLPISLFSNDLKISINSSYYNEPLIKPGVTIAPEISLRLNNKNRIGMSIPSLTYFYFPDSHHALYIYPELYYNFIPVKHFFLGISGGSGLALSKIIIPFYNSDGVKVDAKIIFQGIIKAGLNLGYTSKNYDIYGSIGWKGLYPYNLGIKHQPYLQLGYRRSLSETN